MMRLSSSSDSELLDVDDDVEAFRPFLTPFTAFGVVATVFRDAGSSSLDESPELELLDSIFVDFSVGREAGGCDVVSAVAAFFVADLICAASSRSRFNFSRKFSLATDTCRKRPRYFSSLNS